MTSGLKTEVDLSVGQVQTTGNPLDVVNGDGYFVVRTEGGLPIQGEATSGLIEQVS